MFGALANLPCIIGVCINEHDDVDCKVQINRDDFAVDMLPCWIIEHSNHPKGQVQGG